MIYSVSKTFNYTVTHKLLDIGMGRDAAKINCQNNVLSHTVQIRNGKNMPYKCTAVVNQMFLRMICTYKF